MSRALLQYLLPLVLPTVLYLIWAVSIRDSGSGKKLATIIAESPWFWLIVAGLAVAAGSLIVTALVSGGEAGSTYVAPVWKDGRIIPGHIK